MARSSRLTDPPSPEGARSIAELGTRLRALQAWAGLSVREIHRRVVRQRQSRGVPELPALDTVHRCLKPGRVRLDRELIVDIAHVVLGDGARAAEWGHAHQIISNSVAVVTVRHGLPESCGTFVGRRLPLELLLLGKAGKVIVLHGMPGVGKTTFALHAAHQLIARGHFADLQLSVNLHGYDLECPPADPAVVLDGMLRQLGCSAPEVHHLDLHGRKALFRRLLAGKRALILLDDAADTSQVLPLLTGGGTCLTLITSRRQLNGLAARHISLDPFTYDEAQELLSSIVGRARVAHEPAAAAGIADVTGHLPLALALVAGQMRKTPDWTLQDHLTRLVERQAHLSLDKGVAVAIESSFVALPASRQRLLRLLGINPGPTIDVYAAAALAGANLAATARDLDALASDSLLVRRAPDRFEMHDLIRLFAAERASDVDAPKARAEASTRLFDYYRLAAYQAARIHEPHYVRMMDLADLGATLPDFGDRKAATAWLESERPNLIACALYCADRGQPKYTSDLAGLLHHYLYMAGYLYDAEQLDRRASQVTSGIDSARALARLGSVHSWLGRLTEAREYYLQAMATIDAHGDLDLKARWLVNYGILCRRLGHFDEAIHCHHQARATFLERGHEALAAQQLGNLGQLYVLMGQHTRGVEALSHALAVARDAFDRLGEADALGNLGFAALVAGQPEEALDRHRQALRIFEELGDRAGECAAHNGCGAARTALGEPERALEHHCLALAIATEVGDREGEAEALIEAGRALRSLSRREEALNWHTRALRLSEQTGNAWQNARAQDGIACTQADIGNLGSARTHWQRAFELYSAMRTTDASRIATRLLSIGQKAPIS